MFLGSTALAAIATPVLAQDNTDEEPRNTIVVTAQNRSQDLQDVPIRIDVVDAEELAEAGFSSANDLSKIAPVAQVQQDQGTVKIYVRGIGTTSGAETQDTSVVANIDGEYINRPSVLGSSIFDLERVEVLRGPQGTLYGRNSTAGAVNFIARKPNDEFGANASFSYGNYDSVRADAGIDIPVGEGIGIRAAGFYEDRDGYVSHPGLPAGVYGGFAYPGYAAGSSDDNSAYGGRLSLLVDDLNGFTLYLAGEYSDREFTPQTFTYADLNSPAFAPGPNCSAPGYITQPVPGDPHTYCIPTQTNFLDGVDRSSYPGSANGLGRIYSDTWALRGRIEYEFGPEATLSYIAGYREYDEGGPSITPLPVVYTNYNFLEAARTQSHELRLAGEFDNGFIYQIGGFYFKEKLLGDGGFYLGSPTDGFYLEYTNRFQVSDSWSAFGQVEFPVTEDFTLVGGLRYTDNQREGVFSDASPFGPMGPDPLLFFRGPQRVDDFDDLAYTTVRNLTSSDDQVTWLLGVNYEPTPDTLAYAKVSTGFKGGGFNVGEDASGTDYPPFAPETNTAYEVGLRQALGAGGQHLVNATGFYYDYSGLQVNTLLNQEDGSITYNAGKATIWGIEVEGAFELTPSTFFNVSINYLDATLDDLRASYNVICNVGPDCDNITAVPLNPGTDPNVFNPGTDYSGNRPGFAPEWIITVGFEQNFDLASGATITASLNTTFKSSYFTTFRNYNDGRQDSFTQTDINVQWRDPSERFTVAAFVRNLENERPLTQGYFLAAGPDDIYNWQFGSPRLYGVRVGFEY